MFCKSCGNKIDDDSQFCSYCGIKQSGINKITNRKDEVILNEEPKMVNENLSVGRQSNTNNNDEIIELFSEPKYDSSYSKETDATAAGVVILALSLLIVIFQPFEFDDKDSYNEFLAISSIVALVLRVLITIWVVNIAKRQKRETLGWGFLAFFLPSIALIIIGKLNKKFSKFGIDNSLSAEENSLIIFKKAQAFINDKKYSECIRFAEKAYELDQNNKKALALITKAKLQIPINEISNKHTQIVYRETKDKKIIKIISKYYKTIGASVFINDEIAPDGVYHYLNDSRKLIVKGGKIEQITK